MSENKKFSLPALPFGESDLSPTISSDTIQLHYGKHHQAYFNMLNTLAENTKYNEMSLEEVVVHSFKDGEQKIFNNASQAWNHILYWDQMKPGGSNIPEGQLHTMIEESFGNFDLFKDKFIKTSVGVFGSGWCWLVQNESKLEILGLPNGENPMAHGKHAIMGIDVWEHAYYLDYKNVRPNYVKALLENSINWSFVQDQLK
ncbi:MAG: superoxide dismutase [Rickettsiales bacterium TMED289]|nr:MAG: superoxide dismutase [Rickettsiales bacterium TMED289]